ncbi:Chorismate--pyruvate lyase [hydrothermal vent metagenome]|uniref:Chorismate--pyruvate lyase n=1 Tax=hydrothermal vent metagenome TaxID=652676 RepID=A0A1W1BZY2_9ZZZZ
MLNIQTLVWVKPSEISIPNTIKDWLLDETSLTEKLKKTYPNFNLKVLSQKDTLPYANEEFIVLKKTPSIREVLLLNEDTPLVFARSIIPYTQDTKILCGINNKPLGEILFNSNNIKRSSFEITKQNNIWGRRATFTLGKTKILVAEFFLNL